MTSTVHPRAADEWSTTDEDPPGSPSDEETTPGAPASSAPARSAVQASRTTRSSRRSAAVTPQRLTRGRPAVPFVDGTAVPSAAETDPARGRPGVPVDPRLAVLDDPIARVFMRRNHPVDRLLWLLGGPSRVLAVGACDLRVALPGIALALIVLVSATEMTSGLHLASAGFAFGIVRIAALMWPVRISFRAYVSELSLDAGLLAYWLLTTDPATAVAYWVIWSIVGELLRTHVIAAAMLNMGLGALAASVAALTYSATVALVGSPAAMLPCALAATTYVLTDHFATVGAVRFMGARPTRSEVLSPLLTIALAISVALSFIGWGMTRSAFDQVAAGAVLSVTLVAMIAFVSMLATMTEDRTRLRLVIAFLHRMPGIEDDGDVLKDLEQTARVLLGTDDVVVRSSPPSRNRHEVGFSLRGPAAPDLETTGPGLPEERWLVARIRDLESGFSPGELGSLETLALVAGDSLALRRSSEATAWLATHDVLTRLPNRTMLLDRMVASEREGDPGAEWDDSAVVLIDIDGFKEVNDTISHEAGDHVLAVLGPRIAASAQRALGPDVVAARLGGDEFAVFLPAVCSAAKVQAVCEDIRTELRAPIDWRGRRLRLDASIGFSVGPRGIATSLLREADTAMYQVKHGTKGGVAQYLPAQDGQEATVRTLSASA